MEKIIFCSNSLDIGGIERATLNYIKAIDKSKYEVYLFLDRKEGIYLNEVPKNVKILSFNRSQSKNILFRKISNLFKILYFSIRYYNKFGFAACFATSTKSCAILAKRFSKNNAIWFHGIYWDNLEVAEKFLKYIRCDKYQKVVFVANKLKEIYLEARPNTKQELYVINNLIDYQKMIDMSKKEIKIERKKTTFLNVGRHEEYAKKLTILINSVGRLVKEGYDFDLWLVGDGPDTDMYKELVKKLSLDDRVTFFGKQNNVFPYYKKCDCVVLSSYIEGNPVVYLESKVMRRPIISTDVTDAKTELDGYGIVSDNNSESFYLAMKEFLDNGYKLKRKFDPKEYNNEILNKLDKVMR